MNTPTITDGGPAFPQHGWTTDEKTLARMQESGMGMTLRDYFAGKAMSGDWAAQSDDIGEFSETIEDERLNDAAKLYYRMADAMLKAREVQSGL